MRALVAPDSFKGSLSAPQAAEAIAAGLARVGWASDLCPLADGGEGTAAVLAAATGGHLVWHRVTGPLGRPVRAAFAVLGDGRTAVVEMATASGLGLVPPGQRDPRGATSRGTGELLAAALDAGLRRIVVGLGGSATNDGGAGLAQALGARLLDGEGHELAPGGAALARLTRIDATGLDRRLAEAEVTAACDVDNPLAGPDGASVVFGPQKGADPAAVGELDAALAHWGRVLARDVGVEVAQRPGAGAAGGLGAALLAFCGARLVPGVELVLETVGFAARLTVADLVVTGEGRLDAQTAHGKLPLGVARAAAAAGTPVICLAGEVTDRPPGFDAVLALPPGPVAPDQAMARTGEWLADAAERAARLLEVGRRLGAAADRHGPPPPRNAGT